jgi:hypothetical protein
MSSYLRLVVGSLAFALLTVRIAPAADAVVRINEVNANIASGCDLIELRVVAGGTLDSTNDFIVVHTGATNSTCKPASCATSAMASKVDSPSALCSTNFDAAFDWYSTCSHSMAARVRSWMQ